MGKSYSMDLRERIVAQVAAGGSRRGAARRFGVSDSCAVTGEPRPLSRPCGAGP